MAIALGDNIKLGLGLPNDARYYSTITNKPWSSCADVNSEITGTRYTGLTVNILGVEYWYKDGILDGNLIEKISGSDTFLPYTMTEDVKDPTGFINNDNIQVTYNVDRTITLSATTGSLEYYFKGTKHSLGTSWTSSAHADTTDAYFLYSTGGTDFNWSTTPWSLTYVMVAARPLASNYAIREIHGTMPWQAHVEFHQTIGTYRVSGFGFTDGTYALQPVVPVDSGNTIGFEAGVIKDEDINSSLAAWLKGTYTHLHFTGASSHFFITGKTAVFDVGVTYPKLNIYDGTGFTETEMSTGEYANWYVLRIPVTSDAVSQQYRAVIVQPQFSYSTLESAQAENPLNLYLGDISTISAEYVFVERVTFGTDSGYSTTGKVRIEALSILSGTRLSQVNTVAGLGTVTAGNVSVSPQSPYTDTNLQDLTTCYATDIQTALNASGTITGGTNGLSTSGANIVLGGTLTSSPTICTTDSFALYLAGTTHAMAIQYGNEIWFNRGNVGDSFISAKGSNNSMVLSVTDASDNTQTAICMTAGGSVNLYHSGTSKFETTNTGATVTGTMESEAVKITTGAASGCVLQSDGSGNASWATPAGGGVDWGATTSCQIVVGASGVSGDVIESFPELTFDGSCLSATGCTRFQETGDECYPTNTDVVKIETHSDKRGLIVYGHTGNTATNYAAIIYNRGGTTNGGNYGLLVDAGYDTPVGSGRSHGIWGRAGNKTSRNNHGVIGQLDGDNFGAAIHGSVGQFLCSVCDCQWAGYFAGPVCTVGTTWSTTVCAGVSCATTCVTSPITCGTTRVQSPIVCATTCVDTPLVCVDSNIVFSCVGINLICVIPATTTDGQSLTILAGNAAAGTNTGGPTSLRGGVGGTGGGATTGGDGGYSYISGGAGGAAAATAGVGGRAIIRGGAGGAGTTGGVGGAVEICGGVGGSGGSPLDGNVCICGNQLKINMTDSNAIQLRSQTTCDPYISFHCDDISETRIGYVRGCGTANAMTIVNDGGGSLTIDNTNTCLFSCSAICIDGGNSSTTTSAGSAYLKAGCNTNTAGYAGSVFICAGNQTSASNTYCGADVFIYAGCAGSNTCDGSIFLRANNSVAGGIILCGAGGAASTYVALYQCGSRRFSTTSYGINLDALGAYGCGVGVDWIATSDCRLKTCISPIICALSTVDALCGVNYQLCSDELHANRIGLIAQDVDKVLPEVVTRQKVDKNDTESHNGVIEDEVWGIKYSKLTAILIEAVKELKAQNIGLQNQINELKNK